MFSFVVLIYWKVVIFLYNIGDKIRVQQQINHVNISGAFESGVSEFQWRVCAIFKKQRLRLGWKGNSFTIFIVWVADTGFPKRKEGVLTTESGAPTYYFAKSLTKTAWKWKNLDLKGEAYLPLRFASAFAVNEKWSSLFSIRGSLQWYMRKNTVLGLYWRRKRNGKADRIHIFQVTYDLFLLIVQCYNCTSTRSLLLEETLYAAINVFLCRGYAMIIEGQEKDDFWSLLGGKGTYSSDPVLRVRTFNLHQYISYALFTLDVYELTSMSP